jgi:hypothetical protein
MELKQLTERVMSYLEVENIDEMSKKIFELVMKNDDIFYEKFLGLFDISSEDLVQVSEVLSEDFMQKIFQYYLADRKEKMQDYTPLTLARFVGMLAGEDKNVIDMCAGSGALTIQKWNLDHDKNFLLYEFDENVIPILIFNMSIRNINAIICHADVLKMEVFKSWKVSRGEKFGIVKECDINEHLNF